MTDIPSTKIPRPLPPEFKAEFIAGGWEHVSLLYGKRRAKRFYTVSGGERLSRERLAAVRFNRAKA